jgi:GT2 family glycosyltransferase/glycosyltransferase involved in cell wall biosynthesis/SAM-dependent methyltransferase
VLTAAERMEWMSSGLQGAYDEYYFRHYAGRPYARDPHWLDFFANVAERIVREVAPSSVLDAGCAMGFLVEALRARGVDAVGVDVSPFALSHVADDVRPHCRQGSIVEPLSRRFDLVVCIEVLEHLGAEEADEAVAALCAASDDVLMSSTPYDYKDATHENVRPPDYWATLFARHGFFHDVEYDASYVAPWAMRFRRRRDGSDRIVAAYERRLWELARQSAARREIVAEQRLELARLEAALSGAEEALEQQRRAAAALESQVADRQQVVALLSAQLYEQELRHERSREREGVRVDAAIADAVRVAEARAEQDLAAERRARATLELRLERETRAREGGLETLRRRLVEKDDAIRALTGRLADAQRAAREASAHWALITSSRGWRLLQAVWRVRARFLPRRPTVAIAPAAPPATAGGASEQHGTDAPAAAAWSPHEVASFAARSVQPRAHDAQHVAPDTVTRAWTESTPYRVPDGVSELVVAGRPVLTTREGGRVAVDQPLLELWRRARDRSLADLLRAGSGRAGAGGDDDLTRAALGCLAEAGLLARGDTPCAAARGAIPSPQRIAGGPLVSAVIVAFDGRDWLATCLPSLLAQTWSALEIVVVDNGSRDGTAHWLATSFPTVRVLRRERPEALAAAINRGVAEARGEQLLILNQDVELEPDAVAELVAAARTTTGAAAFVPKLRFTWAPAFLNGLGNAVGDASWGSDEGIGQLDLGQLDDVRTVASGCFAALMIPREAWQAVGPADERFAMYYEDAEWCHRARLLGFTIRAVPRAVVRHAFGSRVPSGEPAPLAARKLRHVVAGRLRFAAKIVPRAERRRFLRGYRREDLDNARRALRARHWPTVRAYAAGRLRFLAGRPRLWLERRALHARTSGLGHDLFAFEPERQRALTWHGLPELGRDAIETFYLPLIREGRTRTMPELVMAARPPRLLIVSQDVVDRKLAGPGMRYLEMARALAGELDVTLAVPAATTLDAPPVKMVRYFEDRPGSLHVLVENADVAVVSGYMARKFPFLAHTHTRLVVDLYDPLVLENLHYHVDQPLPAQERHNDEAVDVTNTLAQLGDFFLCGNERQRDFWLGTLVANRRVNPRTFARDPSLASLIDVVGVGLPSRPPRAGAPLLRGVHEAFPEDARIVLWGGGIWDWLDPLTLVEAWPRVVARHPEARLVFLGTRHPNPLVPPHRMAQRTEDAALRSGERERTIFFHEWLSYEDRERLLCEADVGVTLHPLHVETRFSVRTRVLDCFWARLPVVITAGDLTSEWVDAHGVGRVVPPADADAVARALNDLLDQPRGARSAAFAPLREALAWERVVEPLRRYCREGVCAADRLRGADAREEAR